MLIGDVVGEPGLAALENRLPSIVRNNMVDIVMANGENAYGGFGITAPQLERIFASGVNIVSSGNHVWEQRDFWPVLESEERIIRPMNYPSPNPGRGWAKIVHNNKNIYALNFQGREFLYPLDCPFKTFDSWYNDHDNNDRKDHGGDSIILVDFHAESSREKEALAYYLDGRVSLFAGTHTHVQTADERILPKGTAYITDLGMTGMADGVIGMDAKICMDRARNQVHYKMEIAPVEGENRILIQGVIAEIDMVSGKALSIKRISE